MNYLSILRAFDEQEVEQLRKQFRQEFDLKVMEERKYCVKNKVAPMMDKQKSTEIMNLLNVHCRTAWQVEALKRMVLTDFYIPEVSDLDEKANALMTDALKGG